VKIHDARKPKVSKGRHTSEGLAGICSRTPVKQPRSVEQRPKLPPVEDEDDQQLSAKATNIKYRKLLQKREVVRLKESQAPTPVPPA